MNKFQRLNVRADGAGGSSANGDGMEFLRRLRCERVEAAKQVVAVIGVPRAQFSLRFPAASPFADRFPLASRPFSADPRVATANFLTRPAVFAARSLTVGRPICLHSCPAVGACLPLCSIALFARTRRTLRFRLLGRFANREGQRERKGWSRERFSLVIIHQLKS